VPEPYRHLFDLPRCQKLPQWLDEVDSIAKEIMTIDDHSITHSPVVLPSNRSLRRKGSPKPSYKLGQAAAFATVQNAECA
jgi:hypothetical protein